MNNIELEIERDELIKQLLTRKFIRKILVEWKPDRTQLLDDFTSVEDSLSVVRIREYLNLNEDDGSLLNLGEWKNISLSYTAQKIAREELIKSLRLRLTSLGKFILKMQLDLPHLFEANKDGEGSISASCMELINLEQQRREKVTKLSEIHNQQIQILKEAIELKLGPGLENEVAQLHDAAHLSHMRVDLVKHYMIKELVDRSEHSVKAIKEVEGYIDKQLDS